MLLSLLVLSATRPVFSAQELAPPAALLAVLSTTAQEPILVLPVTLSVTAVPTQATHSVRHVQRPSTQSLIPIPVCQLAQTTLPTSSLMPRLRLASSVTPSVLPATGLAAMPAPRVPLGST